MKGTPAAGRLRLCLHNWRRITDNPWVLQAVQGYRLKLYCLSFQATPPRPLRLSLQDKAYVREEVASLEDKGAVQKVAPTKGQFLSTVFVVLIKDGSQRPVVNLKPLNQFYSETALQDGGYADAPRSSGTGRLDGVSRSDGCIPVGSDSSRASKAPEVHVGEDSVRVSMLTVRVKQCPTSLYQDLETGNGSPEAEGNSKCNLHRRHASDGPGPTGAIKPTSRLCTTLTDAWFCHKLGEVGVDSQPTNPVPGFSSGFKIDDPLLARGQDQMAEERVQGNPELGSRVSPRLGKAPRQDDGNLSGRTPSCTTLSKSTVAKDPDIGCDWIVRDKCEPEPTGQVRAGSPRSRNGMAGR